METYNEINDYKDVEQYLIEQFKIGQIQNLELTNEQFFDFKHELDEILKENDKNDFDEYLSNLNN